MVDSQPSSNFSKGFWTHGSKNRDTYVMEKTKKMRCVQLKSIVKGCDMSYSVGYMQAIPYVHHAIPCLNEENIWSCYNIQGSTQQSNSFVLILCFPLASKPPKSPLNSFPFCTKADNTKYMSDLCWDQQNVPIGHYYSICLCHTWNKEHMTCAGHQTPYNIGFSTLQ